MSLWTADVGEVTIKLEYRIDFGHLFRSEYDDIENKMLREYVLEYEDYFIPMENWTHMDYKTEWAGRYKTCYNEETGLFVYGAAYNLHGVASAYMHDFMHDILPAITDTVISEDGWIEDT